MVPELKDIMEMLDKTAPFSFAEKWDNSGLQVGYPSHKIKKILVALDPTVKAVKYASNRNAQLLLTHHPLIFEPVSQVNPMTYPGDVINEALLRRISIVAVHTNLDAANGGINDILANKFGLKGVEPLGEKGFSDNDNPGIGRIGYLPEALDMTSLIKKIKKVLNSKKIMVVGSENRKIKRVAVIGGSSGGMITLASKRKADLLITGDIKHDEALLAESLNLALIGGGHFKTEKVALDFFADYLNKKMKESEWSINLESFDKEREPMRYM